MEERGLPPRPETVPVLPRDELVAPGGKGTDTADGVSPLSSLVALDVVWRNHRGQGHGRLQIFWIDDDDSAFERILAEVVAEYDVSVFSFPLMPNHSHLVLRPNVDGEMSPLLRWVTATHTMRDHAHDLTSAEGHLDQGYYNSFPLQDDQHFLTVCRYVERNTLRAELVSRAEQWH